VARMKAVVAMVLVAGGWAASSPQGLAGQATYMRPGLMADVVAYRGLDLGGYTGAVALNRRGDLGRSVWVRWPDGSLEGPLLVVDCAQRGEHYRAREWQGRVIEVDAETAQRHGFYGVGPLGGVRVYFDGPVPCNGLPCAQ
jgi:hypothetical protein